MPHALAKRQKELKSSMMKTESINKMQRFLSDTNEFNDGWELYQKAAEDGLEAEAAMIKIHKDCENKDL